MDKIIIKGLKIYAHHGVNPEEKEYGQNFILDITASLDLSAPCRSDNLEETVNYAKVVKTVTAVFTAQKDDLIERAAYRVAAAILENFDKIKSVTVLLKKPEAPVKAEFEYVAAEITLGRGELQ